LHLLPVSATYSSSNEQCDLWWSERRFPPEIAQAKPVENAGSLSPTLFLALSSMPSSRSLPQFGIANFFDFAPRPLQPRVGCCDVDREDFGDFRDRMSLNFAQKKHFAIRFWKLKRSQQKALERPRFFHGRDRLPHPQPRRLDPGKCTCLNSAVCVHGFTQGDSATSE
jgi:hypothetical protein